MRKISALLTSLFCIWILLPCCLQAESLSEKNSLTLHYYNNNESLPLTDVSFQLYRIAEIDENGDCSLTEQFSNYQVDVSDLDWNEAGRLTMLAITLSAYAERDNISPLQTKSTDSKGNLTFDNLEKGLYLVCSDILLVNIGGAKWNFISQPLLLPLPYPNIDGSEITDMEVDVKYDRFPLPKAEELVSLTVMKKWEGGNKHPDSITVQLMCNGVVTDSAELNEDNNWKYTWKNLSSSDIWQIAEENVPNGYTVSVHQEGYVFTITNKKYDIENATENMTRPTTDVPSTTDTLPSTDTSPTTDTPPSTDTSPTTDTPSPTNNPPNTDAPPTTDSSSKIPQTGQLWWPVPFLSVIGLIMIINGIIIIIRRKKD